MTLGGSSLWRRVAMRGTARLSRFSRELGTWRPCDITCRLLVRLVSSECRGAPEPLCGLFHEPLRTKRCSRGRFQKGSSVSCPRAPNRRLSLSAQCCRSPITAVSAVRPSKPTFAAGAKLGLVELTVCACGSRRRDLPATGLYHRSRPRIRSGRASCQTGRSRPFG